MGNNIYFECSCWKKDQNQLSNDYKMSSILSEINNKIMNEDLTPKVNPIQNNHTSSYDNQSSHNSIVTIQKNLRRLKGRNRFQAALKDKIDIFDNTIINNDNGRYISEEEMLDRSKFIDQLERQKIGSCIKINKEDCYKFPLTFQKGPILFMNDDSIYKGSWNYEGKKHGYGLMILANGSKIEGMWIDDYIEGRGRFIDTKGNYYEGDWHKGTVEGKGLYVLANGSKYDGQWKNDLQEGYGKESFVDGSYYEGNYHLGYKEGEGCFTWLNGSSYRGTFSEVTSKGEGIFKWLNGKEYKGQWENNQLNGYGTFLWPNGKKYVGEYKNSKKEGLGIYYWNDDTFYKGYWKNNVQHGEGEFHSNGIVTKGVFRFGKLIKCSSQDNTNNNNNNDINNQEIIMEESNDYDSQSIIDNQNTNSPQKSPKNIDSPIKSHKKNKSNNKNSKISLKGSLFTLNPFSFDNSQ